MKTDSIQQEILLFTNTSFTQKEMFEKDSTDYQEQKSPAEQLAAACWNGFLDETLRGIVDTTAGGESLYLWEINEANTFLDVRLCAYPLAIDTELSINPYAFLSTAFYS